MIEGWLKVQMAKVGKNKFVVPEGFLILLWRRWGDLTLKDTVVGIREKSEPCLFRVFFHWLFATHHALVLQQVWRRGACERGVQQAENWRKEAPGTRKFSHPCVLYHVTHTHNFGTVLLFCPSQGGMGGMWVSHS